MNNELQLRQIKQLLGLPYSQQVNTTNLDILYALALSSKNLTAYKQDLLVSGVNIKTINGNSLL